MPFTKPSDMFDRDWEWSSLTRFVGDEKPMATLGVVSGRRRQGKTFLLMAACDVTNGFYYAATETLPRSEALRQLAEAVARFLNLPGEMRFRDWEEAIDALLGLGDRRAIPVVIDEFPYLVRQSPELPSVIQKALAPRRPERLRSRARLLLCGSSISFMGGLLMGNAPLRGRAALELVVPTFDFRVASQFWQFDDPRLAALVYFVLGGTPAYRTEYLPSAAPATVADFDSWLVEHLLSPDSPLFREVRSLLAEDPTLRDTGIYHTVLAAVAEGNATRGGIANRLERRATDLSHHLTVLEDAGFLVVDPDAFRRNRSQYRITEPLVRFYHAIMRPRWPQLERFKPGRTEQIWRNSQEVFRSNVIGPVFERMCRLWAEDFASEETFQGIASRALSGTVYDTRSRSSHEIDVAVFDYKSNLLSIGEVKWGDVIGMGHLERLEHVGSLLAQQGKKPKVITLFSGKGFMPTLVAAAERSDGRIQLVDLPRLYGAD
ncbi:MAG TPA: hypothetical protein VE172_09930 [Stackebrandtia sp.]|nr:hypothetical protein [Stackebrandtia sp.]HZE39115.1 hypothetical protein [Stackebrandtia sp.]